MRPNQNNKRMRGRNNNNNSNRKGPNPLSRSYESNGPDVKIRGTAHHIGEKYLQLARDAQSSGDPVMAESYLQHAEHYFRIIAAAQQAQQAQFAGYNNRQGAEAESEELEDEDDFSGLSDRFASPAAPNVAPQPQPQPYVTQPAVGNGQGQPNYNGQPNYQERPQYEPRAERGPRNFQDRNQDRNNQDRPAYGERNGQNGPRDNRENGNGRNRPPYEPRGERAPRYDNSARYERHEPRNVSEEATAAALPAFITAPVPVRIQPEPELPVHDEAVGTEVLARPEAEAEENNFALRPRRRRRAKPEFGAETKASFEE
jgi:Domain of unknown function (DUF4167)